MLESIVIFSQGGEANPEIAQKAVDYLTSGANEILSSRNVLADAPGPGVIRARLAITGVEKSKESLKAHNVIPVSAIFRGAQAASGNVPTYIAALFESEFVDSTSGDRVAAIVRKGISETDKRSGDEMTFDDVQPTLDLWLQSYATTVDAFITRKN